MIESEVQPTHEQNTIIRPHSGLLELLTMYWDSH